MKYYFDVKDKSVGEIRRLIESEPQILFASLVSVDLGNNHTDEKIPIKEFLDNLEEYLTYGIQTDGSSVVLTGIAEINDAKVDIIPDRNVKWFVDYAIHHSETKEPNGTLLIPSFLSHHGKVVGSRGVLQRATEGLDHFMKELFQKNPEPFYALGIPSIKKVQLTLATELEFWVESLQVSKDEESLFVSQKLKEQYWKRLIGSLRDAMEETLITMERFGLKPEMGHKEVGGVGSKLSGADTYAHMEQVEIDWKYADALQAIDHEWLVKDLILDIFHRHSMNVTFKAKPIEGVSGSGEHHHISVSIIDSLGKAHNLFTPNTKDDYLSIFGYGALMGLLKHYPIINPFISNTIDALNRLQPGFEAPVSTVCSLGHTVDEPSRNRTVLVGLIRDLDNPFATRFELRSPNASSNSYLLSAASVSAMMDGISYSFDKDSKALLKELSKAPGEEATYLNTALAYRSEENIFESFTEEERSLYFGRTPRTIFEIIEDFEKNDHEMLLKEGVFTEAIISGYMSYITNLWLAEVSGRLIPEEIEILRRLTPLHENEELNEIDCERYQKIKKAIVKLMKDTKESYSLVTKLHHAIEKRDLETVSKLQLKLTDTTKKLKKAYSHYKKNIISLH
ncbi:type I glutamate--ammonia ligase [Guggenheimella bovis]